MGSLEQHLILHHLDEPLRILYWTMDEALFLIGGPFIGLGIHQVCLGLITGLVGFYTLRKLKQRFGDGSLKHAMYWYLPHNRSKLKITPASFIREYIG